MQMTRYHVLLAYQNGMRDFSDADLRWAYLSGANLSGANLRGANLSGANLSDANLRDGGVDPRGWRFIGQLFAPGDIRVNAGCRYFTIAEARQWWGDKGNADALARVDLIEKLFSA